MNANLDILNNPNATAENDFCIINLNTGEITWKAGMYNPKMANSIEYWLSLRNYNGANDPFSS